MIPNTDSSLSAFPKCKPYNYGNLDSPDSSSSVFFKKCKGCVKCLKPCPCATSGSERCDCRKMHRIQFVPVPGYVSATSIVGERLKAFEDNVCAAFEKQGDSASPENPLDSDRNENLLDSARPEDSSDFAIPEWFDMLASFELHSSNDFKSPGCSSGQDPDFERPQESIDSRYEECLKNFYDAAVKLHEYREDGRADRSVTFNCVMSRKLSVVFELEPTLEIHQKAAVKPMKFKVPLENLPGGSGGSPFKRKKSAVPRDDTLDQFSDLPLDPPKAMDST